MFTDLQAQAAVRDGTAAIEVLVVQRCENGYITVLSGQNARQYRTDTQPSTAECRIIASQRLRLPSYFSKSFCIDEVIQALEKQAQQTIAIWQQAPMLQGELFLILNSDGTAELAGKKLYYDPQLGLAEMEE